ncbi:MAG: HAMP domain-containing histidine kinase [Gemmatimonadetes bacterium]|nr:HAMP domain-containing histidine kinase [Gemmatimonadota bacterium]
MSLRKKIIALFVVLAVCPLLILAWVSHWQAEGLLTSTLQGQLERVATGVGTDLEKKTQAINEDLDALALALSEEPSGAEDPGTDDLSSHLGQFLAEAAFIRVADSDGSTQVLHGVVPTVDYRCEDGQSGGLHTVSRALTGPLRGRTVTAGFWVHDLVNAEGTPNSPSIQVVDSERGTLVFADHCDQARVAAVLAASSAGEGSSGAEGETGAFSFEYNGGSEFGALARIADPEWTVTAISSPREVLASLNRMALAYWIFVLVLGFSTALAFSILIGRYTRSLSELSRAAEEIGLGELDPWLPLPSDGELGNLTRAFNRMLGRVRHMMKQVDQSGRLAVVGQLSAYLAHEIRNPLSSIKMNLQRLKRWTDNGAVPAFCLEPLEISLREVERLSSSVAGVLQLSRSPDSPRETASLHVLVEEAAELLGSRFRKQGVELVLDLDAGADRVLVRPGQIKGVILNLMVNALEAQPKGGSLNIRSELSRDPTTGGPVVGLHFKDEGPGVHPEIRDRIFEPFFTTKTGGSGIGLAMASQALRENHGELFLEPSFSTSSGSEFIAVLPLAAYAPTPRPSNREWVSGVGSLPSGSGPSGQEGTDLPGRRIPVPAHLMSPDGLKAVLALSRSDSEEVN